MDKELFQRAFEQGMRITERHLDDFKGTESHGGFPAPASENNRYPMIDNNDWTAGFYTGILWMCYEYSGNPVFRDLKPSSVFFRHLQGFPGDIRPGSFQSGYPPLLSQFQEA